MLIDVIKHDMIPVHEVMSKQEQEELLGKLNATKEQLPKILDSDVALTDLKVRIGDIIRIKRKSPVAGETLYYRVVVKK